MAYDKVEIFNQAKRVTQENNLFFVDDIIAYLPCSKSTFYEFYPDGSDELDELKRILESNRVTLKVGMRKKWNDSDNATLQLSLMKLVCTDDERKKLAMQYNEHSGEIKTVNLSNLTTEELVARAKAIKEVDEQTRV